MIRDLSQYHFSFYISLKLSGNIFLTCKLTQVVKDQARQVNRNFDKIIERKLWLKDFLIIFFPQHLSSLWLVKILSGPSEWYKLIPAIIIGQDIHEVSKEYL